MEFKIQLSNIVNFTINKAIQIFGIIIIVFGIIFMLSLISYSPNDPNFIFPNEKEINNLIGIKGSILSDFFNQLGAARSASSADGDRSWQHRCQAP